MNKTKIDWADYVWNPVTGCTKVSQGCKNCYAEAHAHRFWGSREFTNVLCHKERLKEPYSLKRPSVVFVNSMSDLFHQDVPYDFIDLVFMVMARLSDHTFIILTKRPERMKKYIDHIDNDRVRFHGINQHWEDSRNFQNLGSSLINVWLGVSVEDQKTADERIPILLSTPAYRRFISYEPALEDIDLSGMRIDTEGYPMSGRDYLRSLHVDVLRGGSFGRPPLDWVIMGCESGPHRRPMDIEWARHTRDQCQAAGVPFFLKQMEVGGKVVKKPILDGQTWLEHWRYP